MAEGQQHRLAAPQAFEMAERRPAAAMAGLVSRITGYRENERGHFRQVEAASLDIPLVISFGEPFAIGLGRAPGSNDRYGSFAAGLFAGPVTIDSFGASNCVQINFTPLGARRFFGMPMTELTDRMVTLDDVLGAEGMSCAKSSASAADWEKRFDIAEAFVMRKLGEADRSLPRNRLGVRQNRGDRRPRESRLDRRTYRLEPQTPGAAVHRRDRARPEIGVAHRPAEPRDGGGESRR